MRQKNLKYVSDELLNAHGVITNLQMIETPDLPTFVEIGSGKGQFITRLAKDFPKHHYIAIEVNRNVCYRILEKKDALNLENLTIIQGDAENLLAYLSPKTVDGIYLNFSDPWPKKKHHKRRLTAKRFLELYQTILKPEGTLQFRTDHKDFFLESMDNLDQSFECLSFDMDLSPSDYMTEYEEKKRSVGPIYQWIGRMKTHVESDLS